ncbi:MAG TPA: cell division protein ZapE, partial [Steroidobacteraceae bacterium]|nr:cell division protein ZapE [Steroidobacteraceae bacterium]
HENPLELVAERLARRARVLCFDEFFVTDVADALLLGTLLDGIFARGVTLVATSNVPPADLYRDGLQRARFLPAIALLERHTEVVNVDSGTDYRLRLLERGSTWFDAADEDTPARLLKLFDSVAGEPGTAAGPLTINHRRIDTVRRASDVVWFDFDALCSGPRGQADYIEIARCYHTVFLTDVPVLGGTRDDSARRFLSLVDEFYDRGVKLIVSAPVPPQEIYRGERLAFEFQRTTSRLIEMQTHAYLGRAHRP